MSHPNKSFISPFHEGAANILAGRTSSLPFVLGEIHALNPGLEIPDSPTINDLASLLRLNERRRSGRGRTIKGYNS